jgi:hypothetical protein
MASKGLKIYFQKFFIKIDFFVDRILYNSGIRSCRVEQIIAKSLLAASSNTKHKTSRLFLSAVALYLLT